MKRLTGGCLTIILFAFGLFLLWACVSTAIAPVTWSLRAALATPTPDPMGTAEEAIDFVKKWTPIGYETVPIGEGIVWSEHDSKGTLVTVGWSAIPNVSAEGWRVQWHNTLYGKARYSEWWYNPKEKIVIPILRAW